MTTAVIGANGFLGRRVAEVLVRSGEDVISVFNKNKGNLPYGTEAVSMDEFIKGKLIVDNVIFSAGSFRNSIAENVKLNCSFLYKLTRKYKNRRFVYISSANVYGNSPKIIKENSTFYNPNSYGLSKLNGEYIVSSLDSYSIVRPVYLYGKGLENGSFLPFIVQQAKNKGIIPLYGQGQREQDYLHVDDAAQLVVKALFKGENKIYLGATGKSVSNKRVANIICDTLNSDCRINYIDSEETSYSLFCDPSLTKKELEWYPQISIEEGIKDFLK